MQQEGIIYLISDSNGLHKIGMTRQLNERRMKQLQTGNGNELVIVYTFKTNYPFRLETLLHRYYRLKCVRNEWFELTHEDVIEFPSICKKQNDIIEIMKDNVFFGKNLH